MVMAYRRSYRRRTNYRKPKAPTIWIRDVMHISTDLNTTNYWDIDLLWKARTGDSANLQQQAGGTDFSVQSSHASPEPTAPLTVPLPPQTYAGASVKRVIVSGQLLLAETTASGPLAMCAATIGPVEDLSLRTGGDGNDDIGHPNNVKGSVTEDYFYYDVLNTGLEGFPVNGISPNTYIWGLAVEIDTRCTRPLKDWGDTIRFRVAAATGGVTINDTYLFWSILLQPH